MMMKNNRAHNFIDITNQIFDFLKVIELKEIRNKKTYWLCICNCGNYKIISGHSLRSNKTKSCGCLKNKITKNLPQNKSLPDNISAKNNLFYRYKKNAQYCNRIFDISFDNFIKITSQNCHYCKIEPQSKIKIHSSIYVYNGIDRLDNLKGYTQENCVTCCFVCNRAKGNMHYNEFIEYLRRFK